MSSVLVEDHQVVSQTSRINWSRVTTPARVPDQDPQQVELLGGELELLLAQSSQVRLDVDPDAVGGGLRGGLGGAAAEQGADPGEEFGEAEGLGDVVVGAGVQADQGAHLVGAGRQHQDRHGVALGAEAAGDFEAVHPGQPQIEDHEVDAALQSGVECRRAVLADLDLVASRRSARASGSEMDASSSASSTQGHGLMVVRPGRTE
ncbi:hypothetical protein SALBM217S_09875 [Streptomyces griseoloalbus]